MDSSPISKFAATSTDTAWAQSYSAGKLSIVLSLEGTLEGVQIASLGKETLEKLQREFFAIDNKTLESLKKMTEEVAKTVPAEISLSLVIATTVQDILYLITADSGFAVLKRGQKVSVVAEGEKGEISGFSGKLEPGDTILMGTADLFKTIPLASIGKALHLPTPNDIGENLSPFIHENAKGTEAGITWIAAGLPKQEVESSPELEEDNLSSQEKSSKIPSVNISDFLIKVKSFKIPSNIKRKYLIIVVALVLLLVLVGSILFENSRKESNKQLSEAENLISENKSKYEDALALMSINKSLAVNDLTEVKDSIEQGAKKFPKNSPAEKKLQDFLNEVNNALGGEGGSSKISLFYDSSKNSDLKDISILTTKGADVLTVIGKNKSGLISYDGTVDKTFSDESNVKGVTADEDNIFILSEDSVLEVPRNSLKPKPIINSNNSPVSIDTFGGNVYLLSSKDKTIYRYRPGNFSQDPYLSSGIKLSNPVSMAIDSSIFVLDNGKIRKFTKGAEENFSVKNNTSFSNSSKIFTDVDYANLYVLDPEAKKVYIIDKTGNQVNEFSLKGLKNISSIAANEKEKKIYLVADGNIYSISF